MAEFNKKSLQFRDWPHGEIWALGDEGCICALLEEHEKTDGYEMIPAPRIEADMNYSEGGKGKKIRVYRDMDVRLDLEDLFAKLEINYPL